MGGRIDVGELADRFATRRVREATATASDYGSDENASHKQIKGHDRPPGYATLQSAGTTISVRNAIRSDRRVSRCRLVRDNLIDLFFHCIELSK